MLKESAPSRHSYSSLAFLGVGPFGTIISINYIFGSRNNGLQLRVGIAAASVHRRGLEWRPELSVNRRKEDLPSATSSALEGPGAVFRDCSSSPVHSTTMCSRIQCRLTGVLLTAATVSGKRGQLWKTHSVRS